MEDAVDPNLFAIDWEQTGEVLVTIIVMAFIDATIGKTTKNRKRWGDCQLQLN
jgi:hypothetical protein